MNPIYNQNIPISQDSCDDSIISDEPYEFPKERKVKKSKKYLSDESYPKYKKKINKTQDDDLEEKPTKINWKRYIKSIVIYTLLFLIMSHVKMNSLICGFIPYLNNHEILCMIIKGVIMSILILIIQTLY